MRCKLLALAAMVMASLAVASVRADVSYAYATSLSSQSYADLTPTTYATTGGSVTLNLYLVETLTGGNTTSLINYTYSAHKGLNSVDVGFNYVNGATSTVSAATINTATLGTSSFGGANSVYIANGVNYYNSNTGAGGVGYTGTASLSGNTASNVSGGLNLAVAAGSGNIGPTATEISSTLYEVLLGTITIQMSANGTSNYSLSSADNAYDSLFNGIGAGGTLTNTGVALDYDASAPVVTGYTGGNVVGLTDSNGSGFYDFSVSNSVSAGVPEPSSMLLCGIAISGMGYSAWRRRKAGRTTETETAAEPTTAV